MSYVIFAKRSVGGIAHEVYFTGEWRKNGYPRETTNPFQARDFETYDEALEYAVSTKKMWNWHVGAR